MRLTGATDAQLLAACERNAERSGYTRGESNVLDLAYFGRGNKMAYCAECLVRPDQRIVDVADLRWLLQWCEDGASTDDKCAQALIDRITALLE